jgi:hypothetical protein
MRQSTEHTGGSGAAFTLSARELLLVAFVLVVPIPLLAVSGLNVPLPGIVERVAGSLVVQGGADPSSGGSILRARGETVARGDAAAVEPTRTGSPLVTASRTAAATAERRARPQRPLVDHASGASVTESPGVVASSGSGGTPGSGTGKGTAPAGGGSDGGTSGSNSTPSGGSSPARASGTVSVSAGAGSTDVSVAVDTGAGSPGNSGETTVSAGVSGAGASVEVTVPGGVSQPTLPVPGGNG